MPTFRYVAKKSPTEVVESVLEAENREAVLQHLAELGYTPLQVVSQATDKKEQSASSRTDQKIRGRHLQLFTRQFAGLMRAQIPMVRALNVLKEQTTHHGLRSIIEAMVESIQREGHSLSEAMRKFPKTFSLDYVNLVNAGEVGGILEQVLDRLSAKLEREEALTAKLKAALVYPMFVGITGPITVGVLMAFVMPRILKILTKFGGQLPLPTKILLTLTYLVSQWWFWLILAGAVAFGFILWKTVLTRHRVFIDGLLLKIPVVGQLLYHVELVRFCRSLGLLMEHGVPILSALQAAVLVVGNHFFQREVEQLPAGIRDGGSLSDGIKKLSISNTFLIQTIAVGEEGGRVGEALIEAANFYEQEADRMTAVFASVLEPLIILFIGGFVGFIVMAILLPIFSLSGVMK